MAVSHLIQQYKRGLVEISESSITGVTTTFHKRVSVDFFFPTEEESRLKMTGSSIVYPPQFFHKRITETICVYRTNGILDHCVCLHSLKPFNDIKRKDIVIFFK